MGASLQGACGDGVLGAAGGPGKQGDLGDPSPKGAECWGALSCFEEGGLFLGPGAR